MIFYNILLQANVSKRGDERTQTAVLERVDHSDYRLPYDIMYNTDIAHDQLMIVMILLIIVIVRAIIGCGWPPRSRWTRRSRGATSERWWHSGTSRMRFIYSSNWIPFSSNVLLRAAFSCLAIFRIEGCLSSTL